jgi:hypothetical protein
MISIIIVRIPFSPSRIHAWAHYVSTPDCRHPNRFRIFPVCDRQRRESIRFAAAAFLLRDVRLLFRQRLLKRLDQSLSSDADRATAGSSGRVIDGMSVETIARLGELQISTYMDLAYVDPIRIMAKTGAR